MDINEIFAEVENILETGAETSAEIPEDAADEFAVPVVDEAPWLLDVPKREWTILFDENHSLLCVSADVPLFRNMWRTEGPVNTYHNSIRFYETKGFRFVIPFLEGLLMDRHLDEERRRIFGAT